MLILIATAASICDATVDRLLAAYPTVVEYCERCGDKAPGVPHPAEGRPADLASTYVKTSDVRYENLALLANCIAEPLAVPSLRVLDETSTGVLIVPDTAPVSTHIEHAPVVHVRATNAAAPRMWPLVLAGAGGGGAVVCVLTGLALYRRRKQTKKLGTLGGPTPREATWLAGSLARRRRSPSSSTCAG